MRRFYLLLSLALMGSISIFAKPAAADANGKLPGMFTISSGCSANSMVYFSQGNLQYIGSAEIPYWKFAEEQYEYFGTTTGKNSTATNADRDLFAFGTKNEPWYSGASNSRSWTEWGENAISNGGNAANSGWRTLTPAEWSYLIGSRSASTINGTANARYALAFLCGTTHGIILFPDQYTHPDGVALPAGINTTNPGGWDTNQYSADDWAKMEAAGCVFWPAAGFRYAPANQANSWQYSSEGTSGRYWCSSSSQREIILGKYSLYTSDGGGTYAYAYSVRLVKNVPTEDKVASVTTAPTANSLSYTGSAQALVNAGTASGGTMMYRLGTTGSYSASIPTATNAGDYIVQYMVDGTGCFNDFTPDDNTINVTIAQANYTPSGSYSVTGNNLSYTGSAQALATLTGSVTDGTIYYKLGDGDWSTSIPTATDIGDYHVWYKVVPTNSNYKSTDPVEVLASITFPTVTDHSDVATINAVLDLNPTGLKIERTIYADDEYNTICLPFALDESALAASPLAGFNRLKTFKGAQVTGTAPDLYIDIFVEDATTIEAGIPYLITYPSAHADIVNPVFTGITVTTTTPSATSADGVTFQGMFAQVHIDPYTSSARDEDYLFLGANSQLYWPSSDQTSSSIKMRGFRAYFIIDRNSISPALAPKGTRARIMDAPKTTTAIDNTSAKFGGSEKIIENGILYIIRNGVKYNAQGQIVK